MRTNNCKGRMPEKAELQYLYEKGSKPRNLDPVFKMTGWSIWATEEPYSRTAWSFNLLTGEMVSNLKIESKDHRAFAVCTEKATQSTPSTVQSSQTVSSGGTNQTDKTTSATESLKPPSKYTKLDSNGKQLPDSAQSWVMVLDNATSLVWEVKQNKDGVQNYGNPNDADNTYSWDESSKKFINALNAAHFGGFSDWRLPSLKELKTIVDSNRTKPAINTDYFPNTQSSSYWSSISDGSKYRRNAAGVNFFYGHSYDSLMGSVIYVRAVRDGQ